jgi:hypothetical protein
VYNILLLVRILDKDPWVRPSPSPELLGPQWPKGRDRDKDDSALNYYFFLLSGKNCGEVDEKVNVCGEKSGVKNAADWGNI